MLEEDKRGILLESGTNEIEVMEFTIFDSLYGINVAKVLEIMMACPVVPMQKAQKDCAGQAHAPCPPGRGGYFQAP